MHATEELAHGVDNNFDWESEAVEYEKSSNMALEISGTWWTLGVVATALLFGSLQLDARLCR